jgi:hypothetical protein
MGKSSKNEILILIEENETNENEMYIEKHVEKVQSENMQTENNKVEENGEQIIKKNLQRLHVQRKNWKGHNIIFLCWAFYCVNDGKEVEATSHQVMRCILCYDNVVNILNARIKERKGLITCYKTYDIIVIKKHVDVDHFIIAKKFEEEINNEIIESVEREPTKKRPNVLASAIFVVFVVKEPFKKDDVQQKDFFARPWPFDCER